MATSANKTAATPVSVDDFIAGVADPRRREEGRALKALFERVTGWPAVMWGPSIVGFGRYRYRYDSGREGEMCRTGFSPRKAATVVYLIDGFDGHAELLARLGPHTTGRSCLYLKRLDAVDNGVLEAMIRASVAWMAQRYPDGA